MLNHSDVQTTTRYIGLTEEKNRQLINDHGEFIHNVLAGKGDEIVRNIPVISLKTNDLNDIIMEIIKQTNQNIMPDVEIYNWATNRINELRVI